MQGVDLNDIAIFVRVVERGSFADAARELQVPTSTVSRTIARLEATLGAQLLHRTTRALRPTSEGTTLYSDSAAAVLSLEQASRTISDRQQEIRGTLRVTAPADLGNSFVSDAIIAFSERHPHVELDLVFTPRLVDLVSEGFDCAIRAGILRDSTLIARKLTDLESRMFAAPSYVAKHGLPQSPAELSQHRCILFRGRGGDAVWTLRNKSGEELQVRVNGPLCSDDLSFVRTATMCGAGIGLLPTMITAMDVKSDRLVEVLDDYSSHGAALYFVHPAAKHTPAKTIAFREVVLQTFHRWRAELVRAAPT